MSRFGDWYTNTRDFLGNTLVLPNTINRMTGGGDLWANARGSLFDAWRASSGLLGVQSLNALLQTWFDFPIPSLASPTYSWDSPQNLVAMDRTLPIVYGIVETGGLILYQGGDGDSRDLFLALSEGPVAAIANLRVNGVDPALLVGSQVSTYLGTASQTPDPRFASARHSTSPGLQAWDFKTSSTAAAVAQFEALEDGAYVLVKVGVALTLDKPDGKWVSFRVEWRPTGSGSWTDGGTYRADLNKNQMGLEEARFPLKTASSSHVPSVRFNYPYTASSPSVLNVAARAGDPTYKAFPSVGVEVFSAGVYDLRVTYLAHDWDHDEADQVLDGQVVLASIEVVESIDAQAFPWTAYLAGTFPSSALAQGQLTATATISGRNTVPVWTGVAWENLWTNNPVWMSRDVWLNSRYGAGQPTFGDARAKLAAAYCDESVGTLTGVLTVSSVASGVFVHAFGAPGTDFAGYLLRNQAGEDRHIVRHYQDSVIWQIDRPFTVTPTTVQVHRQRFRCDLSVDANEDPEDVIGRIATHCRGLFWREGGTLFFDIERPVSRSEFQSGVTVVTPDLMVEGSFWSNRAGTSGVPSGVSVTWWNPDLRQHKDGFLVGDASGEVKALELLGCRDGDQARRIGAFVYSAARRPWTCGFATTLATIALEPGDRVGVAHPSAGWGYDMSDVDAPVRAPGTDREMLIVSVEDDTEGDVRTYLCREYDETLYTDTQAVSLPPSRQSTFVNPFAVPRPFASVRAVCLGDLTADGIANPEVTISWTHPQLDGVSLAAVWLQRGSGGYALEDRYPADMGTVTIRMLGYEGPLTVLVLPLTTAGVWGAWAAAPTVTVQVRGDLTPPAAPTGLRVSFTDRLSVVWKMNTESDFAYYIVSTDNWATQPPERVKRANFELLNPSARETIVRIIAVDRSGNESEEACIRAYLPAPSAPDIDSLVDVVDHARVVLFPLDSEPQPLAWLGWLFQWRVAGGTWANVLATPAPFAVLDVPVTLGTAAVLEWRYAAADLFTLPLGETPAWSAGKTGVAVDAYGRLADLDTVTEAEIEVGAVQATVFVQDLVAKTLATYENGEGGDTYIGAACLVSAVLDVPALTVGVDVDFAAWISANASEVQGISNLYVLPATGIKVLGNATSGHSAGGLNCNAVDFIAAGVAIGSDIYVMGRAGPQHAGTVASRTNTEVTFTGDISTVTGQGFVIYTSGAWDGEPGDAWVSSGLPCYASTSKENMTDSIVGSTGLGVLPEGESLIALLFGLGHEANEDTTDTFTVVALSARIRLVKR